MEPRHDIDVQRKAWVNMPENLDILVTHVPPQYISDLTSNNESIGCEYLHMVIKEKNPSVHLFGHVHEKQGEILTIGSTTFYNCANMDRNYLLNYTKPTEVIFNEKK